MEMDALGRDDYVDLQDRPDGSAVLHLAGRFPLGWCGALSLALSRFRIDIEHATARCERGRWEAQFRIRPRDEQRQLDRVQFLALAKAARHEQGPRSAVQLEDYSLAHGPEGEAAELEIYGPDRLGFLADVLALLGGLAIFPEAMVIETLEGRIRDRFWLRTIGGLSPSPESLRALEEMLEDLVVSRTASR